MKELHILFLFTIVITFATSQPSPPTIAPSFYAFLRETYPNQRELVFGDFWYDLTNSSQLFVANETVGGSTSSIFVNFTTLVLADAGYEIINNQCRGDPNTFTNMFEWLPNSTYGGDFVINGQQTQLWTFQIGFPQLQLSLYVAANNTPVRYIEMEIILKDNITMIMDFENFTPMDIPPGTFDVPAGCLGTGPVCPQGPVTDLIVYMFHTPEDYSLGNMNAADLLGDANFVCLYGENGSYQLVSAFQVQVNATWGQYQLCNYKLCIGLNKYLVGREGSIGMSENGGECSLNDEIGSWYSFPYAGECPNNGPVTENCTWGQVKVLKTITLECLENLGYWSNYCAKGTFPFFEAANVFYQAFISDDPALGGCPNYNSSSSVQMESRHVLSKKIEELRSSRISRFFKRRHF